MNQSIVQSNSREYMTWNNPVVFMNEYRSRVGREGHALHSKLPSSGVYLYCVLAFQKRCYLSGLCPSLANAVRPSALVVSDVDECATGIAVCPRFRKCINTFGSYICKCHEGFDLQYVGGKYQCKGRPTAVPSPYWNSVTCVRVSKGPSSDLMLAWKVLYMYYVPVLHL